MRLRRTQKQFIAREERVILCQPCYRSLRAEGIIENSRVVNWFIIRCTGGCRSIQKCCKPRQCNKGTQWIGRRPIPGPKPTQRLENDLRSSLWKRGYY